MLSKINKHIWSRTKDGETKNNESVGQDDISQHLGSGPLLLTTFSSVLARWCHFCQGMCFDFSPKKRQWPGNFRDQDPANHQETYQWSVVLCGLCTEVVVFLLPRRIKRSYYYHLSEYLITFQLTWHTSNRAVTVSWKKNKNLPLAPVPIKDNQSTSSNKNKKPLIS